MGETSKELLQKIPVEKCWTITAKALTDFLVMRGEAIIAPDLGRSEGFISPLWSEEKWIEIGVKIFGDGAKMMFPMVKETFNIPVKDAIDAAKLVIIVAVLMFGPETTYTLVEATPERAVVRWTKCALWENYKEHEADPAFIPCEAGHQTVGEEGHKAIKSKIIYTLTKSRLRGDPYCEGVYEFKEE